MFKGTHVQLTRRNSYSTMEIFVRIKDSTVKYIYWFCRVVHISNGILTTIGFLHFDAPTTSV